MLFCLNLGQFYIKITVLHTSASLLSPSVSKGVCGGATPTLTLVYGVCAAMVATMCQKVSAAVMKTCKVIVNGINSMTAYTLKNSKQGLLFQAVTGFCPILAAVVLITFGTHTS